MNLHVLSIIVVVFCCAFPTDIYSEPTQPVLAMGLMRCVQGVCDETEFQTKALFNPNSAVEIFTEAKVARSVEHQMATEG